jgi:hypothetical protein
MFTFLKKVFGFDNKTMADAGVQIEQAPYKVDTVVIEPVAAPAVAPAPAPAPAPAVAPAPTPAPAKKKRYYAKKTPAAKKATPKKEVAPSAPAKQPGRKPKAK